MTTKRIIFKSTSRDSFTESLFELEQLIETSKEVELFNSEIYFKTFDNIDMVGLSVIGIDGELFDTLKLVDLKIVNIGSEKHSYLKAFQEYSELNSDQILVIDSNLESFRVAEIQKIVD